MITYASFGGENMSIGPWWRRREIPVSRL